MKKLFTLVAMALMAVGANAQTLIAEKDWTGTESLPWIQFADEEGIQGSAAVDADGIAITVNEKSGQLWQPQANVIEGFNLSIDGNYRVVIVAKLPSDGQLQINMGSWAVNTQFDFPVTATGDFQEISYDFTEFPDDAEGAHVLFQCGDFLGTTIVKSVKVYDLDGEGGEVEPEPTPAPAGESVVAEKDWTGTESLPWIQFADEEGIQGSAATDADGIAITVNEKTGQLWQPQANVVEGFNLSIDGNYRVVVVAKFPSDGQLQINMGSWAVNTQFDFPVTATGDFQEVSYDFTEFPDDAEGAHVLFQCGDFLGTTIVKSVKVIDLDATAIKAVKKVGKTNGAMYNLAGQKVNASYKGVVIKDGKKYIMK